MLSERDLIGVWRLISNLDIDEAGNTSEGPLGPTPKGLLIYERDGYLSVSMMRNSSAPRCDDSLDEDDSPGENDSPGEDAGVGPQKPQTPRTDYMGYSGKWRLVDGKAVHEVEVSSHRHMVDTEQIREIVLNGDRLTLYGTAIVGGRHQRRVLHWQRA